MEPSYKESIVTFFKQSLKTDVKIISSRSLYGGSINQVYLLELDIKLGSHAETMPKVPSEIVVKVNTRRPAGFFAKEMDGLRRLGDAVKKHGIEILIPHPLEVLIVSKPQSAQLLIMEYLLPHQGSQSRLGTKSWEAFGYNLALLHQRTAIEREKNMDDAHPYGYHENTFIGNNVQTNTLEDNWVVFFRKHRLIPQAEWCSRNHLLSTPSRKKLDQVINNLEKYLPGHPPSALLHGDLWSGNSFFCESGKPVIFDPAVYYGHGETDLAMTELFGSYPSAFYDGYHRLFPRDQEVELRKVVYNLYHLLNHLNLFGSSYLSSVEAYLNLILRH